jgi:hypothetical protein
MRMLRKLRIRTRGTHPSRPIRVAIFFSLKACRMSSAVLARTISCERDRFVSPHRAKRGCRETEEGTSGKRAANALIRSIDSRTWAIPSVRPRKSGPGSCPTVAGSTVHVSWRSGRRDETTARDKLEAGQGAFAVRKTPATPPCLARGRSKWPAKALESAWPK